MMKRQNGGAADKHTHDIYSGVKEKSHQLTAVTKSTVEENDLNFVNSYLECNS